MSGDDELDSMQTDFLYFGYLMFGVATFVASHFGVAFIVQIARQRM